MKKTTTTYLKKKCVGVTLSGVTQLVRLQVCFSEITSSSFTNLRATESLHSC